MKCDKCDGEMTQLLTSFFCPKCEENTPSNPADNAAMNKLTNKKCGCAWEDDCDCHTKGGCGDCGKSGGCSAYPKGHSLHSSVKETYVLYGPIKKVSYYPLGGSHEFKFEYHDTSPLTLMKFKNRIVNKIIHKDDLLGGTIGRLSALIPSFKEGFTLYYQMPTNKFCISGPGWSWNSTLNKWDFTPC